MGTAAEHDRKRDQMAEVAARLIEREGLDGVTVREVAAAAGSSTTVVTHYFSDKRELLLHTYRFVANREQQRIDAVLEADPCDLQGWLESLLPLDDARSRDCKVWIAFWRAASGDPAFTAEQKLRVLNARRGLRDLLIRRGTGRLTKHTSEVHARRLLALLMGVAVQAVFDPEDWPAARQRKFFRDEIKLLDSRHG